MDSSGPMATKAPDRFMNVFWDLASLDPSARNDAAVRLCKYLGSIQRALVNSGQLTLTSPTSQVGRHDPDAPTFPELSYALKRLIRGLASTRDAARPGFALALSEVRVCSLYSSDSLLCNSQLSLELALGCSIFQLP
jgi:hypothetical protein